MRPLLWLPCALAWSKEGHEAVGMTAMSALTPTSVTELKRIMKGKDVTDVSGWAHKVNVKYPWTSDLHFQLRAEDSCVATRTEANCKDSYCLLAALEYFYGTLTQEDKPEIKMQQGVSFIDSDALKYLINLIGDLHQPLHFGKKSTKGGKDVPTSYHGKASTLYEFWDASITATVMQSSPSFWWGGWTNIDRARTGFEKDAETWRVHGVKSFGIWANETAKAACTIEQEVKGKPLAVPERLFEQWKQLEFSQVLKAGGRVAVVLNAILESRKAKLGSATSDTMAEFEDKEPEEEKPLVEVIHVKKVPDLSPLQAFGVNFSIFLVILCFYVWLTKAKAGNEYRASAAPFQAGKHSSKAI